MSKASTSFSGFASKIRAKDLEQKKCEVCKLIFRTEVQRRYFQFLTPKTHWGSIFISRKFRPLSSNILLINLSINQTNPKRSKPLKKLVVTIRKSSGQKNRNPLFLSNRNRRRKKWQKRICIENPCKRSYRSMQINLSTQQTV